MITKSSKTEVIIIVIPLSIILSQEVSGFCRQSENLHTEIITLSPDFPTRSQKLRLDITVASDLREK